MNHTDDPLALARTAYDRGDMPGTLAALSRALAGDAYPPGGFLLKAQACWRLNSPHEALQAARAEVLLNPTFPGAAAHLAMVEAAVSPSIEPRERPWATALSAELIRHFEFCSHRYTYKSVPMNKDAFDFALYPLLLWNAKPRTIIEIGSFYGGSAMWMADMMTGYGVDTHVYSIDINKVWTARHDRVTFITGSGQDLPDLLSDDMLAGLPRPWLVIEDADHSFETTTAVLNFFHDRLRPGEYIVVEDGMTAPPALQALGGFLTAHKADYYVDPFYCDYFGQNVTWNVNGFLRRLGPPAAA